MYKYKEYLSNIAKLLAGSGLAQIITIAATLVIARLYSPEDFSYFGIYSASIALMLTFATGRLDLALIQVDKKEELTLILSSAIYLLIAFSVIFLITSFKFSFFENNITILFFTFIGLLATGISQIYSNLFSSLQKYSEIGKIRIISAMSFGLLSFVLAYTKESNYISLIVASFMSQIISGIIYMNNCRMFPTIQNLGSLKQVIIEYKDYWSLDTFSSLMNTIGRQMPLLIFPVALGQTFAGYYFFSQRIIAAPVNLIANSVGNVFRKRATIEYQKEGNFKNIFKFTFIRLFFLSLIGSTLAFLILSPSIIKFLFGEQWDGLLEVLLLVIIFYAFKFTVSPLTYSMYIVRKLHWNLIGQFFYLICLFTPIYIGIQLNLEPILIVALHVFGAVTAYLGYLFASYACANENIKN